MLNSNARLAEELLAAAREVVGDEKASFAEIPQMASEDFSYLAREVPGAYGFLGGQAPYGASNLHNPQFDFDDRALNRCGALGDDCAPPASCVLIRQPIQKCSLQRTSALSPED